jgi:hypothetical protein
VWVRLSVYHLVNTHSLMDSGAIHASKTVEVRGHPQPHDIWGVARVPTILRPRGGG